MKIELEPTDRIVTIDGVAVRIWQGKTGRGVPIHCYIARVACDRDQDCSELDRELRETLAPRLDLAAIPARMVFDE